MKTDNSETNVTPPLKNPYISDTPSSTSTPNVFWPFTRVDPRLLEAIHRRTVTKHRIDQLGEAAMKTNEKNKEEANSIYARLSKEDILFTESVVLVLMKTMLSQKSAIIMFPQDNDEVMISTYNLDRDDLYGVLSGVVSSMMKDVGSAPYPDTLQ
jgi:hypothetical protein